VQSLNAEFTCSKSPINQATSKAMLTQMISIVFRRMETDIVSNSIFLDVAYALLNLNA